MASLEEGRPLKAEEEQPVEAAPRYRWTPLVLATSAFGALALVLTAATHQTAAVAAPQLFFAS